MKIAGIIAEYDPFHAGHAYHIAETKRRLGADGIICVMSGPFVQRGEPAFLDKYARAEAAVRGGADLVLELPPPYAAASAEGFARGGVSLLKACGYVNAVSFGAETDDLPLLQNAAALLLDEGVMQEARALMKEGRSYAVSLAAALRARDPALAEVIGSPNNMLAVEYLKALRELEITDMEPFVLKRAGAAYHDEDALLKDSTAGFPSASAIRKAVLNGSFSGSSCGDLSLALSPEAVMLPLAAKLRTLAYTGADLTVYEDVSPDLAARILAAAPYTVSYAALCGQIGTKAFTLARVKRALMHILLEIRKGDPRRLPAYLKILALREGSPAAGALAAKARLPRITKAAGDRADLAADARFAQDLYHQMVFAAHGVSLPDDFRRSPFILREAKNNSGDRSGS